MDDFDDLFDIDIRSFAHKYGYKIFVADAMEKPLELDVKIDFLYRSIDVITATLSSDILFYVESIVKQMDMSKRHTKKECELMKEIVSITNAINIISKNAMKENMEEDYITRMSIMLDVVQLSKDTFIKATGMELYGECMDYVVDGINAYDESTEYLSQILTEKVKKMREA